MRSTPWRHLAGPTALGTLAAIGVAVILWRRSLGSGVYLFRDFVTVPEPARPASLLPDTYAALRAWPLDGVMWALSHVLPTGVQQLLMLLAVPVLSGSGVAALLRTQGRAAAVAGSVLAGWNPYVAERLLLGQPPTLLAYAAAPWIVVVARSDRPMVRRLLVVVLVALPAALTPWGGLVALGTAVLATLTRADRSWRSVAVTATVGIGWCLPWLLPALAATDASHPDPDGARAFALGDDTGLGLLWSALTGGGVWSETARPASRADALSVAASAVLLLAALAGAACLRGRRRWIGAGLLVGPAVVAAALSGPLVRLAAGVQEVPGVALLRDQHRLLGLAALAQAVLVAVLLGRLRTIRAATVGVTAAALVAAVALTMSAVPDLPRQLARSYRPVTFPTDWADIVAAVESTSTGGGDRRVDAVAAVAPDGLGREASLPRSHRPGPSRGAARQLGVAGRARRSDRRRRRPSGLAGTRLVTRGADPGRTSQPRDHARAGLAAHTRRPTAGGGRLAARREHPGVDGVGCAGRSVRDS